MTGSWISHAKPVTNIRGEDNAARVSVAVAWANRRAVLIKDDPGRQDSLR